MLLGTTTFKCKRCGHQFQWFAMEGDLIAGEHLPHCPKCGCGETKRASFIDKIV